MSHTASGSAPLMAAYTFFDEAARYAGSLVGGTISLRTCARRRKASGPAVGTRVRTREAPASRVRRACALVGVGLRKQHGNTQTRCQDRALPARCARIDARHVNRVPQTAAGAVRIATLAAQRWAACFFPYPRRLSRVDEELA